jgi:Bardet-Biedl syndrome 5 protein
MLICESLCFIISLDSINSVEDTKGNNGERGSLIVTNLRILWISHANSKINLSVGLNTIISANIKQAKSKLRGHTQALCVLGKFSTRFEFIFTSLVKNSPRLFTTVQSVLRCLFILTFIHNFNFYNRAYETSKLYRDLKLRGSIVKDGDLILLPQEQIYSKINGVWNLSSEQGNLGSFFLTNVRVVWHANLATNFNVSLPYMQIVSRQVLNFCDLNLILQKSLRLRESKFGRALVLETFAKAGGYILGFRVDPQERIDDVYKEIQSLYQIYSVGPVFGVDFTLENEAPPIDQLLQVKINEDLELLDEQMDDTHAIAAYYSDSMPLSNPDNVELIQFDERLGLAMEALVEGINVEQLWRVI